MGDDEGVGGGGGGVVVVVAATGGGTRSGNQTGQGRVGCVRPRRRAGMTGPASGLDPLTVPHTAHHTAGHDKKKKKTLGKNNNRDAR